VTREIGCAGRRIDPAGRLDPFSNFSYPTTKPMAMQSKARFLNDVHALLKKWYKPRAEGATTRLTVLEATVYAICHEGTTREQANQALSRFKDEFFDWNEVRVSSLDEIQGVLAGLSDAEGRAARIRRFLRQLFDRTYGFTLESLTKKPLKESLKALQQYEAFASDYVTASVIQQSLGGHAIPVDAPARRALERLGLAGPEMETVTLRGLLERAIPKNRGAEFVDLIEHLAHDTCVEGDPDCPRCELRKVCPIGRATVSAAPVTPKAATKPGKDGAKRAPTAPAKAAKNATPRVKPTTKKKPGSGK
jgi:endonuclease-3